jgi:tetratricopeptide (TPR) repeat protein
MGLFARLFSMLASASRWWPLAASQFRMESFCRLASFELYLGSNQLDEALLEGGRFRSMMSRRQLSPADQYRFHSVCAEMGGVLSAHGRQDEGLALIGDAKQWMEQRELPKDNDSVAAITNLGVALLRAEQNEESVEWMERIRPAVSPNKYQPYPSHVIHNQAVYHDMLGLAYQRLRRYEDAEREIREALELHQRDSKGPYNRENHDRDPGYITALNNLAETLALAGKAVEARTDAQRAAELAQKWAPHILPNCLETLAVVYEAQQELRPAVLARGQALQLLAPRGPSPDLAEYLDKQAQLFDRLNQAQEATNHRDAAQRVRRQLYYTAGRTV